MNMAEVIGFIIDYTNLPKDRNSSMHPEAVNLVS